jgi:hypothetical protein
MPHPSKRKGNRYERELVRDAEAAGLDAERAWASNGRSLGEAEGVDVLLYAADGSPWRVQAKRRKRVAGYFTPPPECDVTAVRADRAETLVVVPLRRFLRLLGGTPRG